MYALCLNKDYHICFCLVFHHAFSVYVSVTGFTEEIRA